MSATRSDSAWATGPILSPKRWLNSLASMRLTIVLLILAMTLVLGGTLAQRTMGLYEAQERYFLAWVVWLWVPGTQLSLPMFPGGYLVGALLCLNLVAGIWRRGPKGWREPAFFLTHAGLILLTAGVLLNEVMSLNSYMEIDEGSSQNYSQDYRQTELVLRRAVADGQDEIVAIPETRFAPEIKHAALPVTVKILQQVPDAVLVAQRASDGALHFEPRPAPKEMLTNAQRCLAVEVVLQEGELALGRWWLSSTQVWDGHAWREQSPVPVTLAGQEWLLSLRLRRYYQGHSVALDDFAHQRYAGSNISAQFSSQVTVTDHATGASRAAVISMNRPLRYGGLTYYQSGYKNEERTTVLQVVRNPGWLFPYLSCTLISLGMAWGFWRSLRRYLARRALPVAASQPVVPVARPVRLLAWGLGLVVALLCLRSLMPPALKTEFDLHGFGRLPVLDQGRVKPLDSVARNSLLQLHGKQTLRLPEGRLSATGWLLQVLTRPELTDAQPLFVVDNPDVLGLMGKVPEDGRYYSFNELAPHQAAFTRQLAQLSEIKTPFDRALANLDQGLLLYNRLKNSFQPGFGTEYLGAVLADLQAAPAQWSVTVGATARLLAAAPALRLIPPAPTASAEAWQTASQALVQAARPAELPPVAQGYFTLLQAWRQGQPAAFNAALGELQGHLAAVPEATRARAEYRYNHAAPFYLAMVLYGLVFVLLLLAWLRWWEFGRQAASTVLLVAVLWHTVGMIWRMWLHGYAPVTNLYSSAVFVGWMAALLSLAIEWRYRHGVGSLAGALVGFCTLIVAHHLARGGETMEMMRAVLASNFWLSTHVTTIAMGYGGMFLAGAVSICALLWDARGRPGPRLGQRLAPTVYGIICFATLFSFVGTVLGGIWADQSWGRFWGWDPKENGAFLIVCWCGVILHGRLGHLLSDRGLHLLAVGGNIITAFSWFGVNLLGVGLHAYGFTDSGLFWLLLFSASQVLIILIGANWPRTAEQPLPTVGTANGDLAAMPSAE